jgi:hypothetical protein
MHRIRFEDYYNRLVADARSGRPSFDEARADLRRELRTATRERPW